LCVDDPQAALVAIDEAIGLYDAGAGDVMLPTTLMDAAVLRLIAGNPAGAADAARRALDHAARGGSRLGG
jgi:hypothetical protein